MLTRPILLESATQQAAEPLGLHQHYFEAFEAVVATLMEPGASDVLCEALSLVVDACNCSVGALYLDAPGRETARLACHWLHPQSRATIPESAFRLIRYEDLQALADILEAGMVLNQPLLALSAPARKMLIPYGVTRVICLPLLNRGLPFGFIALLDAGKEVKRGSVELHFLSMLANVFAQAVLKQRAEQEIEASRQRVLALISATQDMVFELNDAGLIVKVWSEHPALPAAEQIEGMHFGKALPAALANEIAAVLPQVLQDLRTVQVNTVCQGATAPVYLQVRLSPVQTDDQVHAVAMVQDASEMMQEAMQRKTMLDTLNLLEEAVIDLSPGADLLVTTPAWARLRGLPDGAERSDLGQSLLELVDATDRERLGAVLAGLLDAETASNQRFRLLRHQQEPIWVEAKLIAHYDPTGNVQGMRGVLRDITASYLSEQRISQLAHYDTLTRLPNRAHLDSSLRQVIDQASRCAGKVALGFIDLDHFKQVNDALGHKAGDDLLVNVASRLSRVLQGKGMLARWGGDEFVALVPGLTEPDNLRELAESLRQAAQQGVMLEGLEAHPTISVGFAVYPDNAASAEELLSAADHTMYHAKNAGRNSVCFYSDIVHFKVFGRENMAMQSRLSGAIQDDSLQVFYQPIVDAGTGAVLALETLARWPDGKGGWISPELFIPLAEKNGLIQELSGRVLERGLGQLACWRQAGLTQPITVNISRSQLYSTSFVADMLGRLSGFGLRPHDIILEITESVALTDHARQMKHLRQLVEAGFRIAIDDFGTGYSSLSQLHEMPIQFIKIDSAFAQRLHAEDGRAVMHAIVQLAQLLKLKIVAEGIETREVAQCLQRMGVRGMQGFYYSEPVPAAVAELMLRLGVTPKSSH